LNETAVALTGVAKTFSTGTTALAPVDLRIAAGSFVSLVGPSGCGKSTLLRLIADLLPPSAGTIARNWTPGPRGIGFVFQDATLMPWATVAKNVALPLDLAGDDSSVVSDALARVGLADFADAYPRALSGGMRMRAAIARATVTKPAVLLMDEPFAALDEFTRARLNDDLLALWQAHHWTVIFVTHSIREAVFLSERVVVMSPHPGRIVADMAIAFDQPRTATLRDTHAFTDACARVGAALGTGMAAA
jgi:NitT/TauT family transport system ATP-binding protein